LSPAPQQQQGYPQRAADGDHLHLPRAQALEEEPLQQPLHGDDESEALPALSLELASPSPTAL
jgi:hypothetical protein